MTLLISDPIICVANVWRYWIPPGYQSLNDNNDAEKNDYDDDVYKYYHHAHCN